MDPAILLPGTLGGPVGPLVRSPALFDLHARDLSLTPRTGQAATFARATAATGEDSAGSSVTHVAGQPVFTAVDADGDGVREAVAVRLGADDSLSYAYRAGPRAALHLMRFIETGNVTAGADRMLWDLGGAGPDDRLAVYCTGGVYRAYGNTNGVVGESLLVGAPAVGDRVDLLVAQLETGEVWAIQSINGGAAEAGTVTAALGLPDAYGGNRLDLGHRYDGGIPGTMDLRRHRIVPLPGAGWSAQQYLDYALRG